VIAGRFGGRRLEGPAWQGLRPTSDRLRETLFNVIAARIPGARVLDGFAGTGALGIEALSRGAAHVTFVERDRRAVALIARNLERCGIDKGYAIMRSSVDVPGLFADSRRFDVILLDPPYGEEAAATGRVRTAGGWLAHDGVLVLEHARRHAAPEAAGDLTCTRDLVSGDSALAFYCHARAGRVAREDAAPAETHPASPSEH
jgi:16S rRNA (guanine966-N2)-methyltransferase